jgi:hypothetical protein
VNHGLGRPRGSDSRSHWQRSRLHAVGIVIHPSAPLGLPTLTIGSRHVGGLILARAHPYIMTGFTEYEKYPSSEARVGLIPHAAMSETSPI